MLNFISFKPGDKGTPDVFEKWARESYNVAVDFAYGYGIKTVSDPDKDLDTDKAVKKMVQFILNGVSPVEEAPKVPDEYWKKLQDVSHRRLTLPGFMQILDFSKSWRPQKPKLRPFAAASEVF